MGPNQSYPVKDALSVSKACSSERTHLHLHERRRKAPDCLDQGTARKERLEKQIPSCSLENTKIQSQLREKDNLIEILAVQEGQEDLFSGHIPPTSSAWKKIVDQLTMENARLKRQKRES